MVIERRDDIERILTALSRFERFPKNTWITLPSLGDGRRIHSELRLNAAARDCGCTLGSTLMSIAVFGYLALLWILPGVTVKGPRAVFIGIAVALLSAAAGKGLGVWFARNRLIRELRALRSLLPD